MDASWGSRTSGTKEVEEGNVLSENGTQIELANLLGDAFTSVREADHTDVCCDKGANT